MDPSLPRPAPPRSPVERLREWVVWFGPGRLAATALAVIAVVARWHVAVAGLAQSGGGSAALRVTADVDCRPPRRHPVACRPARHRRWSSSTSPALCPPGRLHASPRRRG